MKYRNFFSFILLTIAVCTGFTSCDKDDDVDPTNINQVIVGQWKSEFLGEMYYDEMEVLDLNDTNIDDVYMHFSFNPNGTGYDLYYDGTRSDFSYEIIDGILYISGEGSANRYEIVKFNKNVIYMIRLPGYSYQAGLKLVRIK